MGRRRTLRAHAAGGGNCQADNERDQMSHHGASTNS
jgi:hypothetical protein